MWQREQMGCCEVWEPAMLTGCQRSLHSLSSPPSSLHLSLPPPTPSWPSLRSHSIKLPASTLTPASQPHLASKMPVQGGCVRNDPHKNTHTAFKWMKQEVGNSGKVFHRCRGCRRVNSPIQKLCRLPEPSRLFWKIIKCEFLQVFPGEWRDSLRRSLTQLLVVPNTDQQTTQCIHMAFILNGSEIWGGGEGDVVLQKLLAFYHLGLI